MPAKRKEVSLGADENVLKLDCARDYTALQIY